MSEDRLQKILARAGVASRRAVEEMIEEGRVTVNGEVATLGDKADPERDAIKLDGKRVGLPRTHRYLLLNKPRAVMSTTNDPEGRPTVIEMVPPGLRKALVPVGRLDFLTEGLLLLTDDGDFAQRVAHPRYGCTKTYEVKVRGTPDERTLERLRRGISIDGRRTAPAEIEGRAVPGESENSWWNVTLQEGRTRQIREMFQRVGHPVMKLRRVAIGALRDPNLPLGAVRELTDREVEMLRSGGKAPAKGKKGGRGKGWAAPRREREAAKAAEEGRSGGKGAGRKAAAGKAAAGKAGGRTAGAGAAKGKPRGGKPAGGKTGGRAGAAPGKGGPAAKRSGGRTAGPGRATSTGGGRPSRGGAGGARKPGGTRGDGGPRGPGGGRGGSR